MHTNNINKTYNGAIDFWKFIFCLVILIFHVGEYFGEGNFLFRWGQFSVEFFFVVSGYFMCVSAHNAEKKEAVGLGTETFRYILHKIQSILPAYLFAFCLSWLNWFYFNGLHLLQQKGLMTFVYTNLCMMPDFFLTFMAGYEGKVIIRITWYISAMLIAMLVLYPLLRRYKDTFRLIAAPLIVLILSGYFSNTTHYNGIMDYEVIMTHGVMRAFIGLSLGCITYDFSRFLQRYNFTVFARVLLSLVEFCGYALLLFIMQFGKEDGAYLILFILFFTFSVTTSKQSMTAVWFDNVCCKFLGRFSLYIYLCQSPARALVKHLYPDSSYRQGLIYIVPLTFVFALFGWILVSLLTSFQQKRAKQIKRLFIR